MGDPRRFKNKYDSPRHPWKSEAIEEEKKTTKEYGLKNKAELWKSSSVLKKMKDQAKKLVPLNTGQSEKEKRLLLLRLERLGLLKAGAVLDDILDLSLKNILDRRLQSIVMKKGLARSIKQARQVITHRHITVDGKKVTSPGYLVTASQESTLAYSENSTMADTEHPERS